MLPSGAIPMTGNRDGVALTKQLSLHPGFIGPEVGGCTVICTKASTRQFSFPKISRLLDRAEFRETLDNGVKVVDRNLVMIARPGATQGPRIGLIVSKKVGGAVTRNRVRRILRERFRTTRAAIGEVVDIVIIARHHAAEAENFDLVTSYDKCLKRLVERVRS